VVPLPSPENYPSRSRAVVGQLGIGWARMSGLVTLGTAFTDFLTVVARRGVPAVITRSQSNDDCVPSLGLVSTLTYR
jgi:hypothetical protein